MPDVSANGAIPLPLAARLIHVSRTRLQGWIKGHSGSIEQPIINRQLEPLGGRWALGFYDLLEARFVSYFIERGIRWRHVREVAAQLRREHGRSHPFIIARGRFRMGLGRIWQQYAETAGDERLADVVHRQYAILDLVDELLDEGVKFGPHGPNRWYSSQDTPHLFLDPHFSFGRPVVEGRAVPTKTLLDAFRADGDVEVVADDFGIAPGVVREALRFETVLTA